MNTSPSPEPISISQVPILSWLPWFLLLCTVGITGIFTWQAEQSERARQHLHFTRQIDQTVDAIQKRIDTYIQFLEATHAHVATQKEVSARSFYEFVEQLQIEENLPGIEAIGYVARTTPATLQTLIDRARQEGIPHIQVFPDREASELAVLTYIHPLTPSNQSALGYNMLSDEKRQEAIRQTVYARAPAATTKLRLGQGTDSEESSGFIIYYPVFLSSQPSSQDSGQPIGWLFCSFRSSDAIGDIIADRQPQLFTLTAHNGSTASPRGNLFNVTPRIGADLYSAHPLFTEVRSVNIAGRPWTLTFTSRPELSTITSSPPSAWIPILGGGIALIFFISAQVCAASHRRVLRQREWLRVTLESIGDAVIATDEQGKILFLNSSAEALTGWPQAEAMGVPTQQVLHIVEPTSGSRIDDLATQVLQRGAPITLATDLSVKRRDGALIPVEDSASPIRDVSGQVSGTILVLHDVSVKKRRERLEVAGAEVIRVLAYAHSLDEAGPALIKHISNGLQCDAGALWLLTDSSDTPILRAANGLGRESYELAWETIKASQPIWLDLNQVPSQPVVRAIADTGYATAISLPILVREQPKGALCFASRQAIPCHGDVMQWLSSLRLQIGHLSERRQEETRRQAIIEGAFDSIVSLNAAGIIVDANEAAEHMFRCARERMRGMNIASFIEAVELPVLIQEPVDAQTQVRRVIPGATRSPEGEPTPVELTVNAIPIEGETFFTVFIRNTPAQQSDLSIRSEILQNLTEGVCITDERGTIIFSNRGLERMLHYESEDLIGSALTTLFAPPHDTLPAIIRTPTQEGVDTKQFGAELLARCKDGTIITTFTQVSLIHFLGRRYLLCVQDDITDTKRWQSALIESEHRFRTMANSLPMLIWTAEQNKHVTWANRSLLEFTGILLEVDLHSAFIEAIHPDDRESYSHRMFAPLRDEQELEIEYRLRRFDGSYRWIWEHAIPIYEAEDVLTGYVGSGIDITDRKEAEQARSKLLEAERAARSQLERVSQIKDEFLATLSHELRTPLNAILGWSHLIRRDALDQQRLRLGIEIIEKNAKAQARMIEDLLDMSRIISGKVRIEPKPTEIHQALTAAIESVAPSATAKGVEIHLHLDTDLGRVDADPHRLQQILLNLLSNAVRFSKQGGAIDVTAAIHDETIVFTVRDYGEGIQPEFLPHVFDRFRQADSSTTRKHSGLGLGLAIVKHLVELHGGHIEAESAGAGSGATFTVSLPRLVDRSEVPDPSSLFAPLPAVQAPSTHHALEGIRVLAVDDEPDARNLLKVILEDEGASVTTANSCQVALEAIGECLPDLIVSDIGMPGEDGYQFIRKLRARDPEHGGSVPAIALTAFARPEDRDHSIAAGFQAHMAKPIEPSALIRTVAQILPG